MQSTGSWTRPAVRVLAVTQRFQKFLVVGAIGLAVNQGALFLIVSLSDASLAVASPVAILLSMVVTFVLNEVWTWHDRGGGRLLTRAALYGTINSGGLLINAGLLLFLEREFGMHYLMANLIGAGVAALWNFGLNHVITWRA
jgi:putative flippase GtrA